MATRVALADADAIDRAIAAAEAAREPMAALPAGATERETVTLLGPDTRAPRSARVSGGVVRRLGGAFGPVSS